VLADSSKAIGVQVFSRDPVGLDLRAKGQEAERTTKGDIHEQVRVKPVAGFFVGGRRAEGALRARLRGHAADPARPPVRFST